MSDQIKQFYEDFSSTLFRDRIRPNLRIKKIFGFIDEIFKEHFQTKGWLLILDVACGLGIISERLNLYNRVSIDAVDISKKNIEFATETVKDVRFLCDDFLTKGFSVIYGLVTLFDCLEHFSKEQHWKVFEKINSLSRQGTLVAITTPNGEFLDEYRKKFVDKLQIVDESVYLNEILTYAKHFGFELLKYEKYGIDYEDQYQYFLLRKNSELFVLKPIKRTESILTKIWNKVSAIYKGCKYNKIAKKVGIL